VPQPPDRSLSPRPPHDRLSDAFRRHGDITRREWAVRVSALRRRPGPAGAYCVSVELTAADADALHGAAELATPAGSRGPNWAWVLSEQAAAMVGRKSGTLRAWVAKRGPRGHPFPPPGVRLPGRNLWRRAAVEKWKAEHDALGGHDSDSGGQREG
jgi:hypothetical protein